ncbi:MAG: response regulator [Candidatus Omnitrophica bacterium]|nr:response regulator [Candidatus Omnitrophota bacterium]
MKKLSEYKILIVEDEDMARTMARSFFERRWGAVVRDASDGPGALEILRHEAPDVLLLDVMIEGPLSGWQVITEARTFNTTTKIIVVTGQLEVEKHLAELGGQVAAFIQKPASLSELEARVVEVLGGEPAKVLSTLAAAPASRRKGSYDARRIVHEISNLHNVLRMRCERFILDHEDGFHREVPDKILVEQAVEAMRDVVRAIDEARSTVDKIRDL